MSLPVAEPRRYADRHVAVTKCTLIRATDCFSNVGDRAGCSLSLVEDVVDEVLSFMISIISEFAIIVDSNDSTPINPLA